jgi:transposase
VHRARELLIKQRTGLANQMRGLLAEYGVILPKGLSYIRHEIAGILEDAGNELSTRSREIFAQLTEQFKVIDNQVAFYDREIEGLVKQDERCQQLMKIEGVGPVTASGVVAAVGDAKVFKRGRELAAWLGLVPKQRSSGNTIRLLGISKRGDRYLRTLLIHGARAVVNVSGGKSDTRSQWIMDKKQRADHNKAAVALANKNARIIWAVLAKDQPYRPASIAA